MRGLLPCAVLLFFSLGADSSTRPALQPIELRRSVYLLGFELHVTIGSDGSVRSVRKLGEEAEVHSGKLSPEQMREVAALFANWGKWEAEYPGVADGGETSISYGRRSVRGGKLPREVAEICDRVEGLGASMPKER